MEASIRLNKGAVKDVMLAFQDSWKRYRSPFGVVLAVEVQKEFELVVEGGVLIGDCGDFVCIDDVTFECWVCEPCEFRRLHTIIPIETPE